ncbi:MAG: hypothetical protein EP330_00295 [Deltaproteobacteria bacterium]|nr:MAG: hypothetical protein EP330_00295 [Deltaproteobacteria bacterium]
MRTLIALIALTLTPTAFAQDGGQVKFAKAELAESRADLRDARHDLRAVRRAVRRWEKAAARRDWDKARGIDPEIYGFLRSEREETAGEIQEAKKELTQSEREVAAARREAESSRGAARQDDRQDLRDDRKDLADDRRDLRTEEVRRERIARVSRELRDLQPAFRGARPGGANVKRKQTLLGQLEQLAERDLRQALAEVDEDKIELREDRVERRED